jgi:hypothetical protein
MNDDVLRRSLLKLDSVTRSRLARVRIAHIRRIGHAFGLEAFPYPFPYPAFRPLVRNRTVA